MAASTPPVLYTHVSLQEARDAPSLMAPIESRSKPEQSMKPRLEVADVFRDGEPGFLARPRPDAFARAASGLPRGDRCRTASLGGHVQQRKRDRGHEKIQYNSCRNRHCPKRQAMARAAWLAKRDSELLPVPYFHVVSPLPPDASPAVARHNKPVAYGLLFRAASRTLLEVAADPKHLGLKYRLREWSRTPGGRT